MIRTSNTTNQKNELHREYITLWYQDLQEQENKMQQKAEKKQRSLQKQKCCSSQAQLKNNALQKIFKGKKTATNNIEVQQVSPEQDVVQRLT